MRFKLEIHCDDGQVYVGQGDSLNDAISYASEALTNHAGEEDIRELSANFVLLQQQAKVLPDDYFGAIPPAFLESLRAALSDLT